MIAHTWSVQHTGTLVCPAIGAVQTSAGVLLPVVVLAFDVLGPDLAAAADTADKPFEEVGAVTSGKGRGRCPVLLSYLLDGVEEFL